MNWDVPAARYMRHSSAVVGSWPRVSYHAREMKTNELVYIKGSTPPVCLELLQYSPVLSSCFSFPRQAEVERSVFFAGGVPDKVDSYPVVLYQLQHFFLWQEKVFFFAATNEFSLEKRVVVFFFSLADFQRDVDDNIVTHYCLYEESD